MEAFPQGPWVSRISAALVLVFGLFIAGVGAYATLAPQQGNSQNARLPSLTIPAPTDQEQFIPYWTTEPGWESQIQLRNNQASQPLTVTVVLRTPSGTETNLPSVTLKPHEAVVADVATALRLVAPQLLGSWGSAVLRYKASSEASLFPMAMIREIGKPIALHIDSTSIAARYQTGSREGIWWLPSSTTSDWLILTNEGNAPLSLRLSLYDASGRGFTQQVSLGPDVTARYSVRQLAAAGGLSGSYGGITISAAHNAGSLDTLHFLYDQTGGFSALLKMYDHNPAVTLAERDFAKTGVWTLRAPMLALSNPDPALEFPAGTVLQPMLLIRNTTAAPANASLTFEWKNSTTTGNAVGPSLHLTPHQTQEVDVAALQNNGVLPMDANWAEVKLTTTGKPGDIMATASSYDKTLKYGAQTPFSDQLAFHWAGSVWEYDSTHDSIIAVGNGGTKPTEAAFTLTYNHGTGAYEIDQLLQPDQQMWIDVGQLIRSQVPDKNGVVLPVALSMGSYEIRQLNHRGPGTLFEGKVIYDKKYGSVTYGCSTCCGYTASQFEFSYDPLGIPLDGEEDQEVEGYDTCYGEFVNVTSDFDSSWSTANHAIATVNAYGVHKGVAIGSTTTNASAREQIFNERQDCPVEPVYPTGPDNVNPTVSFAGPSYIAVGQTATFVATVNPSDNSKPISLSIEGGVSIVSPTGTFATSTNVVVKANTVGSVTLTATISGPEGGSESIGEDDFSVYTPIPAQLIPFNTTCAPNIGQGPLQVITNGNVVDCGGKVRASSFCGVNRNLVYQLIDQNDSAITTSYEISESFSNLNTTNQALGLPTPATNVVIPANGYVTDAQFVGFTYPTCLGPNDHHSYTQNFSVVFNGVTYNLSTTVNISDGNFSGTPGDNVTIVVP